MAHTFTEPVVADMPGSTGVVALPPGRQDLGKTDSLPSVGSSDMSQLQQETALRAQSSNVGSINNVLAHTFTEPGVTGMPDGTAKVAQPSVSQDLSKQEREYPRSDSVDMINNWGKRAILKPVQASKIDTTQKGLALTHSDSPNGGSKGRIQQLQVAEPSGWLRGSIMVHM